VGVFRFASIDARNGKLKWETDWIVGKLHEVTDDSIFVSDTKFFYSLLTKTGKKNEKWSVELLGGSVVDLDASHAYLYRKSGPPKLIQGIDLKNGSDAFRIEMGPADDLTHVARIGHRIVYYDSAKHLHGYDTLAKKEIWKWQTLGQTIPGAPKLLGPGLSVYKDGRMTLLDPTNGTPVWEVRGTYISVNQIGSEGVLANKLAGSDLIRRRREAAGEGVFFTSTRTPIRFSLGVTDAFSVPSVADGVAYTLSSSGWLVACNVKEGKVLWQERVSRTPLNPLCPPFVLGDRVAVHLNGETHVLDLANKGQVYKTPHQPLRPDLHLEMLGTAFPSTGRGRPFGLVEFATGKRLWDAPLQGVTTYALGDGKIYAATASSIVRIDAKTGAVEETQAQARGVTGLAWDGKRLVAATGPYGFGFFAPAEEFKAVFRAKEQNPALVQKFRGWIAAPGGDVVYSNADGEVSCFEGGAPDKVAWSFKTPFFTSPLLAHEGKIWLASHQQGLFGLDQKSGRIVWKREKVDAADYTPILWEGRPAFWSAEGWVLPTE
jgi:outer membrane protein assembly factor BamB